MRDFTDEWKVAKKSGITALKKFAGPQSDVEKMMQEEVWQKTAMIDYVI